MLNRLRQFMAVGAIAAGLSAPGVSAQVVADAVPMIDQPHAMVRAPQAWQPSGPHSLLGAPQVSKFSTFTTDPADSVLNNVGGSVPAGAQPGVGPAVGERLQAGDLGGDDGVIQFVDQGIDCNGTGYFSNNNSNINPFLAFDDFRADGSPLRNVRFYGGVFSGSGSLNAVSTIGIEIWTISTGTGDLCGWTYNSFVAAQTYSLSELNPTFVCNTSGFFDSYQFDATFANPIALNAGQVYMITVYATLVNPNGSELFVWTSSTTDNFNRATSWDRTDGTYARCGPGQAFATNVTSDCFENDCQTTCFFSNLTNNNNPFISLDDFTARQSGDLRQLQFTGGVYDLGTGTGGLLGNISGFYIEVYGAVADNNFPCGNYVSGFLGAFTVSMADARPVFDCIDIFGIPHYQFTVSIPAGVYPLVAGQDYHLGVYGVPVDPNSTELFCWGGTDAVYGFTSWSFNLDTGAQEVCHDVDQAFCINGPRPCLGDFNKDGVRNTQDVLAFLNAWTSRHPSADINGDGVINTQDVLIFLNRWNVPC
jgi:hypothetical protein